ncbi:hypothetical protein LCGC14_1908380 [marine sediment metagenome]|uniref:Uncharacterized protein n=1 Tax=marine sediment metagenome TaxID=412755 RepID=A0A0F9GHM7_9ZZZZ
MAEKKKLLIEVISNASRAEETVNVVLQEGTRTFTSKPEHFMGQLRNYIPAEDDDIGLDGEDSIVVTNVRDKLDYIFKAVIEGIDLNLTKEKTNSVAFADIIVDGTAWAEMVPVNAILSAETRVKRLRSLLLAIPTLEPKETWNATKDNGKAIFKTGVKTKIKTKKVLNFQSVAAATDKHPEQIKDVYTDEKAGVWETTQLSGKISPSTKSKMLSRLDKLSGILQNARERANHTEVLELKFGNKIRDFVMSPLKEDLKV